MQHGNRRDGVVNFRTKSAVVLCLMFMILETSRSRTTENRIEHKKRQHARRVDSGEWKGGRRNTKREVRNYIMNCPRCKIIQRKRPLARPE